MKKTLALLFACGLTLLTAENLVKNGDFAIKNSDGKLPEHWQLKGEGNIVYNAPELAFELQGQTTRLENSLFLKSGRKYRLTLEVKTEDFKGNGGVYITNLKWRGGLAQTIPQGTYEWRQITGEITIAEPQEPRYRLILFVKAGNHGKIFFRNVKVEEIIDSQSKIPFITAGLLATPPVIDGKLDDDAWRKLPELTPFIKRGAPQFTDFAVEQSSVKAGYDSDCLYIAFRNRQRCLEPARNSLDQFKANVKDHDGNMSRQDCNLVFISPDGGTEMFYEISVNGIGTLTDAICRAPDYWTAGRDAKWSSNAAVATQIGDGEWTTEMAIPWKSLGITPEKGKEFTICLGRLNQDGNEGTTYFEMPRAFHTPEYFGKIRLGGSLPGWNNLQWDEIKNGENILKMENRAENLRTFIEVSDDRQPLRKFSGGQFRVDADRFSTIQLVFAGNEEVFQISPAYRINCIKQQIFVKGASAQFKFGDKLLNDGQISIPDGLYDIKGLQAPFQLGSLDAENLVSFSRIPEAVLVNHTTLWPKQNREFHIAQNSLQPLFIAAYHNYPGLTDLPYVFNIAIPQDMNIVGASDFAKTNRQFAAMEFQAAGTVAVGPSQYKLFQVKIADGLKPKPYYQYNDGIVLMLKLNSTQTRKSRIFYWADFGNGKIIEAPGSLDVTIYPPLRNMTPKKFITEMCGGAIVNLNNHDLIRQYILHTLVPGGFNDLQNAHQFSKGTGITHYCIINFRTFWGHAAEKFAETRPESRRVNQSGQFVPLEDYNPICPREFVSNPDFQKILTTTFERYCRNYQHLKFDYERPVSTGDISCYCPACLDKFRLFAKLPGNAKIEPKNVYSEHRQEWISFVNQNLADIAGTFKKIINGFGSKLSFYSGYQSAKTREQYSVDWNLVAPHIDIANCGYRNPAELYLDTMKALGKTPLITGVLAAPWRFISQEAGYQVDKAFVIKGIVLGSKGFSCYNAPQLDGRSYHSMSEATALLAKYEHVMYDGQIDRSSVKIPEIPPENWALFTHPNHPEKILIIYNEINAKPLKYTATLHGKSAVLTAVDEQPSGTTDTISGTVVPGDYHAYVLKLSSR